VLNIAITDLNALTAFWLIFSRWLAVFIQLPIVEGRNAPQLVVILTSVIISYALYPFLSAHMIQEIIYIGPNHFWLLTIFHVIVGLLIGLTVKSIMDIFVSSGLIISQQVGFGAMRYFDPTIAQTIGPFERLLIQTILLMVVFSGALLPMFRGIFLSFTSISLLNISQITNVHMFFFSFFKGIFTTAIMLASPLLLTNLVISFIMGIMSRTVPQMNVLMVSFIINIVIGILVFILTSNEFFQVSFKIYTDFLGKWFQFIK